MTMDYPVIDRFADRPTLRAVARQELRPALSDAFPTLSLDPDEVCLGPLPGAKGTRETLTENMLQAFADDRRLTLDASRQGVFATSLAATAMTLNLDELASVLNGVMLGLADAFDEALLAYWRDTGKGQSQVQWLAGRLKQRLADALAQEPGLDPQAAKVLAALTGPSMSAGPGTCIPGYGANGRDFLVPVLVVVGNGTGEPRHVMWAPDGAVTVQASSARLHAALTAYANEVTEHEQWFFYEPEGDVFDALAEALLEAQLEEVRQLNTLPPAKLDEIELFLATATDLTRRLRPRAEDESALDLALPDWLTGAHAADRLAYGQGLQALAAVQHRAHGQAFDDGIAPIGQYAAGRLQALIRQDHPEAANDLAGRVKVKVARVDAVPVPTGGVFTPIGAVERVSLTLAEFALGNLASLPHGSISLSAEDGAPLPAWMTAEYAKALVTRADIGQHYPLLIRRLLRDDPNEVVRRRGLFRDQLRVQLPLRALEQKIRGLGGVDAAGWRLVQGLMTGSAVLRPLAFESRPGMAADVACNLFVIGGQGIDVGPFLLYRPFQPVALLQFEHRQALRDAIAAPGALQNEVLAWLPDIARPVYANGGFNEPHYQRVGIGSEFEPIFTPAPARLAAAQAEGDVTDVLYHACVQALVTLAERDSVSDAESRWAMLEEGGWQLLNAVLPFLRGEAAAAAWLTQLLVQAEQWLQRGEAPGVAEAAPLLLMIASAALHSALAPPAPALWPEALPLMPVPAPKAVIEPLPRLQATPGRGRTRLDFAWSAVAGQLTAAQRERLRAFVVAPEPSGLVDIGEGLLEANSQRFVRLDQALYPVRVEEGGVRIVAREASGTPGPWLARGTDGGWQLDLRLRLLGGMPKKSWRQRHEESTLHHIQTVKDLMALGARLGELRMQAAGYLTQLNTATGTVHELFMARMETHLVDMAGVVREIGEKNERLRVRDRLDNKVMAEDLEDVIGCMEVFEAHLQQDMAEMALKEIVGAGGKDIEVTAHNVHAYIETFERLLTYQDKGERWASERFAMLGKLRSLPVEGESFWHRRMLAADEASLYNLLDWRVGRFWALVELSLDAQYLLAMDEVQPLADLRSDELLQQAFQSHAELDRPNDYSPEEQIEVLESALREYARAADVASLFLEQRLPGMNLSKLKMLADELAFVIDNANTQLAALVRDRVEPAPQAPRRVPKVHRSNKRVIRTRGQRTLVGQVREDSGGLPGDMVEVVDRGGTKVLGTYHRHQNGEWVEVVTARPTPPAGSRPLIPLAELRTRAARLAGRVEADIATARRQAQRAQEPEDMQDILVQKAENLENVASELRRHLEDGALDENERTAVDPLLASLDEDAARLRTEGQQLRLEMIKAQPPTAARISYLQRLGKVHIASFGERQNISGKKRNDYMQEFVIRDADNLSTILWWAHFHYAKADARAADYTAAHLKLPEQRTLGYKALVKMARDDKAVVQVYRSTIGPELARRLFLSLMPEG